MVTYKLFYVLYNYVHLFHNSVLIYKIIMLKFNIYNSIQIFKLLINIITLIYLFNNKTLNNQYQFKKLIMDKKL